MRKKVDPINWIVGVDEVGRGCIAGPVTVCMFAFHKDINLQWLFPNQIILDSKKLSKSNRNNIYRTIRKLRKFDKYKKIDYVLFSKSAKYIDQYGITQAIDICIAKCVSKLESKGILNSKTTKFYLDGSLKIKGYNLKQETFIKGDEKFVQIALASIIAKVKRDLYMLNLSKKIPFYSWDSNVGYGTERHYRAIKKFGLSKFHRLKFIKNNS